MRLSRRMVTLLALIAASAFSVGLVILEWITLGTGDRRWLAWNLILAWVPFLLALGIYDAHRRGASGRLLALPSVLWLLFFPNAPYILTDFIHLGRERVGPVWFDALVIASFAFTGLLLGYASLYLLQAVVRARVGVVSSWAIAIGTLGLSSVGIYLGRFVRVNSWSILTSPDHLVGIARLRLADPLGNPKLIAVSVLFTCFLSVTYVVVYSLTALQAELDLKRTS